jgi:protein TonB
MKKTEEVLVLKSSWVNRKSLFSIIFCIILLLHMLSLILQLKIETDSKKSQTKTGPKATITVRLRPVHFKNKKQIVESEDSKKRKKMDDAFLSDKDRFFDRETRARKTAPFKTGKAKGGKSDQGEERVSLSDLAAGGENPFKKAAKDYTKAKNGTLKTAKEIASKTLRNGVPSSPASRAVSSTNDYVEEVPLGDLTNLNTTEYKFYGFYHRIKQKLEQFWGRSLYEKAEQMIKAGRRIASDAEMITALRITLDSAGEIIGIEILGTSGIKELDDAAIESFNEAGPFPNPPKELIVDGRVILEWGFVVES